MLTRDSVDRCQLARSPARRVLIFINIVVPRGRVVSTWYGTSNPRGCQARAPRTRLRELRGTETCPQAYVWKGGPSLTRRTKAIAIPSKHRCFSRSLMPGTSFPIPVPVLYYLTPGVGGGEPLTVHLHAVGDWKGEYPLRFTHSRANGRPARILQPTFLSFEKASTSPLLISHSNVFICTNEPSSRTLNHSWHRRLVAKVQLGGDAMMLRTTTSSRLT